MLPIKLYFTQDKSVFKKNKFRGDGRFFTYSFLSCEELLSLRDSLCSDNTKRKVKSNAGSFGYRARETANDIADHRRGLQQ